jgi:formate dehydrogenase accessory protein FdhD
MALKPADGVGHAAALRVDGATRQAFDDVVVSETPVALVYNGEPYAVMMATPADLEDFALGFALTEGVVSAPGEFRLVDCQRSEHGISLQAAIPQSRHDALAGRGRNLPGRSGCGLCGTEALAGAIRPVARVGGKRAVSAATISESVRMLAGLQPINRLCGGAHAAGFVHATGMLVREDVGRHNALDKLVGAMANAPVGDGFLVMSSRASYEIVHKAAAAGIAIVAAISAPTDLAIRVATSAGITLVAFARGKSMTVYSHPERLR